MTVKFAAPEALSGPSGSRSVAAPGSRRASTEERGRLEHASRQFEALFLAQMLKVMRTTVEESSSGEGSFGKGIYRDSRHPDRNSRGKGGSHRT